MFEYHLFPHFLSEIYKSTQAIRSRSISNKLSAYYYQNLKKMDDYKRKVIDFVRDRPFLWDLTHKDYKNKDQRNQVWEFIDQRVTPPTGWLNFVFCFLITGGGGYQNPKRFLF